MQPLLSIIVPVFRVEKYLPKCVDSLLHQDFTEGEYEIILVDDGSDDHCPQLCDQYAQQWEQIKVIHQPNHGLSAARNMGIRAAKGIYLAMVDSDDYVQPNTYRRLVTKAINEHLDVLRFGYQIIEGGKVIDHSKFCTLPEVFRGSDFLNTCLSNKCFSWLYLVRNEYLLANRLFFTEGTIFEDVLWTPQVLLHAERVMQEECRVYQYVQHAGSITHPKTEEDTIKVIQKHLFVMKQLYDEADHIANASWHYAMLSSMTASALTHIARLDHSEWGELIQQVRQVYPRQLSCPTTFPWTERIKAILINLSPTFFCWLRSKGVFYKFVLTINTIKVTCLVAFGLIFASC